MTIGMQLFLGLLGAVGVERLIELRIARRNAARAFAAGAVEYGRGHYPVMVLLHSSLFLAAPLEVVLLERAFRPELAIAAAIAILLSMSLRYWVIGTLGARWNTRVIVTPGLPAIAHGPFRWIRHPNYVAVVVELFALPMFHGAWITALTLSALNLALLRTRIRVEEDALRTHSSEGSEIFARPRFLPRSS
jgi:methyltransferase